MKKPFWTVSDVALVLTKSKPALYKMRDLGHLPPAMKIGKHLLWDSAKFIEWMNDQSDEPFTPYPFKP